jgi:ribonuclease E
MEKNLYIDASHPNEIRVVVKSDSHIEDYEYESTKSDLIKNNIYLGKVSRIEPSLQAAFIDFGRERHGFLPFNDIQPDYYQLPKSDIQNIKNEDEKIREELKEESKKLEENNLSNENIIDKNENANINGEINNQATVNEENVVNISTNNNENIKTLPSNNVNNKKFDKRRNQFGSKRYKIQEVLKPNQIILVQVLKDERGQKGAALTTFISIAGKYIVLMPNTPKGGGISRKILNPIERKKIRQILNGISIPREMGLIVRTAGSNKTKNEITHDLENLVKIWDEIKNGAVNSFAPALVHEESDIIKRTLRDIYDEETKNIIIEGNDAYQKAKKYMKLIMPKNVKYIKKFRGTVPLFYKENIESKLNQIFHSTIKLQSGGYLVINPTEALVSVDVNSGKSTKEVNIERTALATNLEAADEIGRQIKIRDLSGLIIIDFIDMLNFNNRKNVERRLKEKLKNDRARVQIGRISNFGLLEMSRQRLRESSVKWEINLSIDSFSFKIIKLVEENAILNKAKTVKIILCEQVNKFIIENFSAAIKYCETKFKFKFEFTNDNTLIIPEYKIELYNKSNKIIKSLSYIIAKNNGNDDLIKKKKKIFNKNNFVKNKKQKPFKKYKFKPKKTVSN